VRFAFALVLIAACVACRALPADAQVSSTVRGRVIGRASGTAIPGASVSLVGGNATTATDDEGRFVLSAVPIGEQSIRIERIGFRAVIIEGIVVSLGRASQVTVELDPEPVAVEGVTVETRRVRLIEPTVSVTHEVVIAREVAALPIDRAQEILELTPGVSGGHFRGGRIGQEVYLVDGLEVKNQLEASAQGFGLELPPSALEEVEVITGGVSASYGSALSGVVSYVTRRGGRNRWEGGASILTDAWVPSSERQGFTGLSLAGGGPLGFLGEGATLRLDVLAHGMDDADPRARGLTCVRRRDAVDKLGDAMHSLATDAPDLLCPSEASSLPHQRGDRLIGFARFDRPITNDLNLTLSLLRNRQQRELYTPAFRYNDDYQLGQRATGTLARLGLDWSEDRGNGANHLVLRVGLMRLDRYLGALDVHALEDRATVAGFGFAGFGFLGEAFVRRPIEEQLAEPAPIPGYIAPGGASGSPFGAAGDGLFLTQGTPDIANWTRSDALMIDAVAERIMSTGSIIRFGASARLHQAETYQRVLGHLAGSSPSYSRFHPTTASAFVDVRIAGDDDLNLTGGLRLDAFRSGVRFQRERDDFLSPVLDSDWQLALMPRIGIAMPLPGTQGRTAFRLSYGMVAQAPDFRYFLDSTIGDSLRTDVQRQGNPELSFERGRSYEVAISQLLGSNAGVAVTAFRKDLNEIVSPSLQIGSTGNAQFSTNDAGRVQGVEVSLRGAWAQVAARAGYSLQKATGFGSGDNTDTLTTRTIVEQPLAFDQRHTIDVALLYGRAAGDDASPWAAALTSTTRSGYPRDRRAAAGDTVVPGSGGYLPWTSTIDLRLSRELGGLPGCARCAWRVSFDARNLLGRENLLAVRSSTGTIAPTLDEVRDLAATVAMPATPISSGSPLYNRSIDTDGDGRITQNEFAQARFAAALDRLDPSLFYGEPRQLRLGIEVSF
jgi:hypothetical protein